MASQMRISQRRRSAEDEDDEGDDIPFHRKQVFGPGLHKKAIAFVPASGGDLNSTGDRTTTRSTEPSKSVADLYLSMVLPDEAAHAKREVAICDICKLPLRPEEPEGAAGSGEDAGPEGGTYPKSAHETSLAHQICVPHSHPPSAVDRSRMGLSVLQSRGWDPDARRGLGVSQQGIQFPVKAKPKDDTLGLGIVVPKNLPPKKDKKPQLLDAGKMRKMHQREKKKAERIRRQLFGDDKLEKYLGPGADI